MTRATNSLRAGAFAPFSCQGEVQVPYVYTHTLAAVVHVSCLADRIYLWGVLCWVHDGCLVVHGRDCSLCHGLNCDDWM